MKTRRSWLACLAALLLGAAFTANAHAEAPATENERQGHVLHLLGTTYCFGEVAPDVTCDWRTPPPKPAKTWSLLGFRICLGEPAPGVTCDLQVPARSSAGEVTASAAGLDDRRATWTR